MPKIANIRNYKSIFDTVCGYLYNHWGIDWKGDLERGLLLVSQKPPNIHPSRSPVAEMCIANSLFVKELVKRGEIMFWNVISNLIACIVNAIVIIPVFAPLLYFWPQMLDWKQFAIFSVAVTLSCGFIGLLMGYCPLTRPIIIRYILVGNELTPVEQNKVEQALAYIYHQSGVDLRGKFHFTMSCRWQWNACAFGPKEICLTDSILRDFSPQLLAGIIAHEIGHHIHGDAMAYLFYFSLFSISNACRKFLKYFSLGLILMASIPLLGIITALTGLFIKLVLSLYDFFLGLPGHFMSLCCSRQKEYAADAYAVRLGVGRELMDALDRMSKRDGENVSWFGSFFGDHPRTKTRISNLEKLLGAQS